jgi:DNA-binding NarL/FixJ family response regulator
MTQKIRVLIADDHAVLRDGLHALLRMYDDVEVVGTAADG